MTDLNTKTVQHIFVCARIGIISSSLLTSIKAESYNVVNRLSTQQLKAWRKAFHWVVTLQTIRCPCFHWS